MLIKKLLKILLILAICPTLYAGEVTVTDYAEFKAACVTNADEIIHLDFAAEITLAENILIDHDCVIDVTGSAHQYIDAATFCIILRSEVTGPTVISMSGNEDYRIKIHGGGDTTYDCQLAISHIRAGAANTFTCTVEYTDVYDSREIALMNGITIDGDSTSNPRTIVTLNDVDVWDNWGDGVNISQTGDFDIWVQVTMNNCDVYDNGLGGSSGGDGFTAHQLTHVGIANNCNFYDNAKSGVAFVGGSTLYCNGCTFNGNGNTNRLCDATVTTASFMYLYDCTFSELNDSGAGDKSGYAHVQTDTDAFAIVDSCTFEDPTTGEGGTCIRNFIASIAITGYADQGGGLVRVTSQVHGYSTGDRVNIKGSTNYNGMFEVMAVSDTTHFDITHSWDGNDADGKTWPGINGDELGYFVVKNCTFDGFTTDGDNEDTCINIYNPTTFAHIYNNTFYNCKRAIRLSFTQNVAIYNNIFHTMSESAIHCMDTDAYGWLGSVSGYNIFYNCTSNFYDAVDGDTPTMAQDTDIIDTDPLLRDPANDDFRLLPSSPCINAARPTIWAGYGEIGAWQRKSGIRR
jgi:hypothetical protein